MGVAEEMVFIGLPHLPKVVGLSLLLCITLLLLLVLFFLSIDGDLCKVILILVSFVVDGE